MKKRFLIFFFILIITLGGFFSWYNQATSPVDTADEAPVLFEIPQGQNIKDIIQNLKNQRLIKDKLAFFIYLRFVGLAPKIQAGKFNLKKSMTTFEIANQLTHGTSDIKITIIEGWRNEEITSVISQKLGLSSEEFLQAAKEGYMFPDTYLIPENSTVSSVVQIMLDNFYKRVDEQLLYKAKVQGLDINQLITLASIVEREVRSDEDRKIVAGILLKRVRNDWPLQTDATIQYILGYQSQEKSWWKKELNNEDLQINSPYNTYLYLGLPPGPICNPGISSITAVVSPLESEYWFYISDLKGEIHYAKTQEEHQKNIDQYLKL